MVRKTRLKNSSTGPAAEAVATTTTPAPPTIPDAAGAEAAAPTPGDAAGAAVAATSHHPSLARRILGTRATVISSQSANAHGNWKRPRAAPTASKAPKKSRKYCLLMSLKNIISTRRISVPLSTDISSLMGRILQMRIRRMTPLNSIKSARSMSWMRRGTRLQRRKKTGRVARQTIGTIGLHMRWRKVTSLRLTMISRPCSNLLGLKTQPVRKQTSSPDSASTPPRWTKWPSPRP